MTLVPPALTPIIPSEYIQETLDLYLSKTCKVVVLRPNDCGRKVFATYEKYGDLSNSKLNRIPHIQKILTLQKEAYTNRNKSRIKQMIYPGLPCHKCLELIPIDSKCVTKKGGNNTKMYHYSCAREVNVI